jgi:hypothetical protein
LPLQAGLKSGAHPSAPKGIARGRAGRPAERSFQGLRQISHSPGKSLEKREEKPAALTS